MKWTLIGIQIWKLLYKQKTWQCQELISSETSGCTPLHQCQQDKYLRTKIVPSLTLHLMAPKSMSSQAVKWWAKLNSFGIKTCPRLRKVAMPCSLSLCHATWRPHLVSHASFPLQATQRKCSSHVLTMYRRCLSLFQDRTPLMWCVMKIFTHLRCHLLHRTITKICAVLLQEF